MQVKKNQAPPPLTDKKTKALLKLLPALFLYLLLLGIPAADSQERWESNMNHHRGMAPQAGKHPGPRHSVNLNNNTAEAVNAGSSNMHVSGTVHADNFNKSDHLNMVVRLNNNAAVGPFKNTSVSSPDDNDDNSNEQSLGTIEVDLPERVKLGKPFDVDIWLHPSDPGYKGAVKVYMEQTDRIHYDPRVFDLKAGARKTIKAQVTATEAGLAIIRATADGWEDLSISLDAGFAAKLKAASIPDSIEGGTIADINFSFVNDHGEQVRLDAPVTITFQSSQLEMSVRSKPGEWGTEVNMDIPAGSSSIPTLEVRPQVWTTADVGTIQDMIRLDEDSILSDQTLPQIKIKPRWWILLLWAVFGGIIFSLYKITQELSAYTGGFRKSFGKVLLQRITPGALAGALAYFLANYEVIGFRADTTELRGYLILGFLFAYVGIDTLLKLLAKSDQASGNA